MCGFKNPYHYTPRPSGRASDSEISRTILPWTLLDQSRAFGDRVAAHNGSTVSDHCTKSISNIDVREQSTQWSYHCSNDIPRERQPGLLGIEHALCTRPWQARTSLCTSSDNWMRTQTNRELSTICHHCLKAGSWVILAPIYEIPTSVALSEIHIWKNLFKMHLKLSESLLWARRTVTRDLGS